MNVWTVTALPLVYAKIYNMEKTAANTFVTAFKPVKAIVKIDISSHLNRKKLYAQKHDLVTIVDLRGNVAVCVKADNDWFATDINKLIIQE